MQFTLRFVNVDIPGVTVIGGPQQFAIVGKVKKLLCKYDAVPPVSEVQWIKDGDVIARNSSLLVNESRLTVSNYNESQIQLLIKVPLTMLETTPVLLLMLWVTHPR